MFDRAHPILHAFVCAGLIVGIGYLDHATGNEIRLFPLYFLPVGWAAWYSSSLLTVFSVVASTAAWLLAAYTSGMHYSDPYIWPINAFAQTVAFGSIGAMAVGLKHRLAREVVASRHDALTAVLNKRGFQEHVTELFQALEDDASAVLVFVDLDNFKRVNDEHGHDAGDVALVEAARILRACTRQRDPVARWGGDEFVLLLRDSTVQAAAGVLERLRASLEQEMTGRGWPITASIGAMQVDAPAPTFEAVLKAADELMYGAKAKGKNRVVSACYVDSITQA